MHVALGHILDLANATAQYLAPEPRVCSDQLSLPASESMSLHQHSKQWYLVPGTRLDNQQNNRQNKQTKPTDQTSQTDGRLAMKTVTVL